MREQLTLLHLCLAPLVAAAVLQVQGDRVVVPLVDIALPTVCWSRRWFDVACPGCGLTRGLVSAMHGDFPTAWQYNPAVFVALATLVYQAAFRGIQVWRLCADRQPLQRGSGAWLFWAALVAMFVQWAWPR